MKLLSLKKIGLVLALFLTCQILNAQPIKKLTNANSYGWMFGLSYTALDDDGNTAAFYDPSNWHTNVFPSRIFADKYIYKGWSTELAMSFNQYNPNKEVNLQLGKTGFFLATDANLKYSLNKLLGEGAIDPYVSTGLGLSIRNCDDSLVGNVTPTLNLGLGLNVWLSNSVGIQLQSSGKIGLSSDLFGKSDYMQHSIGLVVKIDEGGSPSNTFGKKRYHFKKGKTKLKVKKSKKTKES
jgi:hypothetical protein